MLPVDKLIKLDEKELNKPKFKVITDGLCVFGSEPDTKFKMRRDMGTGIFFRIHRGLSFFIMKTAVIESGTCVFKPIICFAISISISSRV